MNKPAIATKLLILLASGGTIEQIVAALPEFKSQIDSILVWMRTPHIRSDIDLMAKAARLREAIRQKDLALKRQDFDRAADFRGEECAIFESFWLPAPREDTGHTILHVGIDEQIRDLAALLRDATAA